MMLRIGRTLAYRSNSLRSATFTERWPPPSGVSSGPLRAVCVALMDSIAGLVSSSPRRSTVKAAADWRSQSNSTPVMERTSSVASVISGPTPSPGINVTLYVIAIFLSVKRHERGERRAGERRLGRRGRRSRGTAAPHHLAHPRVHHHEHVRDDVRAG